MPGIENRGIMIKMSEDTALRFCGNMIDLTLLPIELVTTGTAHVHLWHQTPYVNGVAMPWEAFNFTTKVFEVPTDGEAADYEAAAAHVTIGDPAALNTGLWEVRLGDVLGETGVLDDFQIGHQYYWRMDHSILGKGFFGFFQYGGPPLEGIWYTAGSCVVDATLTLDNLVTTCPQVEWIVRTTTGTLQASGITDEQGIFRPQLNPGTYYVDFGPDSRYAFDNPYTLVVVNDGDTAAFTCTATIYPAQGMTFGEIKAHVRNSLADYNSMGVGYRQFEEELIETWVRQAHYQVDNDLAWTRDQVTVDSVADQRSYTVDEAIRDILVVTFDGAELVRITTPEEIALNFASNTSGMPSRWAWWGESLYLYPPPETADLDIVIWARKTPLAMSDDTERPTVPPHSHPLIVRYALMQAYTHAGDLERAQLCLEQYARFVDDAKRKSYHDANTSVRKDGRVI